MRHRHAGGPLRLRLGGTVEDSREQQLLIKTTRSRVADLWTAVARPHPYDVPEFIVVPVIDGNPAYLDGGSGCGRQ